MINGFPHYTVTESGHVVRDGKVVKPWKNFNGYWRVTLWYNGVKKSFYVHRLVAEIYVPNPNNLPQVDHLDEDKSNNHHSNLAWVTASQNMRHTVQGKRQKRLTPEERSMIRQMNAHGSSLSRISSALNIKGINVQYTIKH